MSDSDFFSTTPPLSPDAYRPHIGEDFVLQHESGPQILTLKDVDVTIDDEIQLCFSLMFHCATAQLSQGAFRLSHPRLGLLDLSLVPTQQRRTGPILYQAVFNLLKDEAQ